LYIITSFRIHLHWQIFGPRSKINVREVNLPNLIYLIAMRQVWFGIWQQKTFSFKLVRDRESNLTNKRAAGAPCICI
jgi:hypothetical protein